MESKKPGTFTTEDNLLVKDAKKTLDSAIDEAYNICLPEHGERMPQTKYEQATKLYFKTLYKVHRKFADTIGQIWVCLHERHGDFSEATQGKYLEAKPKTLFLLHRLMEQFLGKNLN